MNENIDIIKHEFTENAERRKLVVELYVDEQKLGDMGTGDYLESKLAQLAADGIEIGQWTITDPDDCFTMARYVGSVFEWAFAHSNDARISSPPIYEEWAAQNQARDDAGNYTMIKRVLHLPKSKIQRYNRLMQASTVDYAVNGIEEYATEACWKMDFGNGYEMVIGVYSEYSGDPLRCQAVLFLDGSEVGCSEFENELYETWTLFHGDTIFTVNLRAE